MRSCAIAYHVGRKRGRKRETKRERHLKGDLDEKDRLKENDAIGVNNMI